MEQGDDDLEPTDPVIPLLDDDDEEDQERTDPAITSEDTTPPTSIRRLPRLATEVVVEIEDTEDDFLSSA